MPRALGWYHCDHIFFTSLSFVMNVHDVSLCLVNWHNVLHQAIRPLLCNLKMWLWIVHAFLCEHLLWIPSEVYSLLECVSPTGFKRNLSYFCLFPPFCPLAFSATIGSNNPVSIFFLCNLTSSCTQCESFFVSQTNAYSFETDIMKKMRFSTMNWVCLEMTSV